MKVTTSCSGRFHIFDQAAQLQRLGILHVLVNDYPKFLSKKWGIPNEKAVSLLANGIASRLTRKTANVLPPHVQSSLVKVVHHWFSCRLAHHVPSNSDIFIGLSSFCLEPLLKMQGKNIVTIVDHGSLHPRLEGRLIEEDAGCWGMPFDRERVPEWIIEKEDREFEVADYVMVLSEAAKRSLMVEGVRPEKIFVNACGVEPKGFYPGEKCDKVFRVIYCGALSIRKGIIYLLEAFSRLGLNNAELCIIGSAPGPDFAAQIRRYRAPNVKFIGAVLQSTLRHYYAQGSVFVLPSLAEGFGMVVTQAMACALPVIVTENVGASDLLTDGVDGFVIPIRDVDLLAERLRYLYEQPDLARQMGVLALRKIQSGYTWDDYGNRLQNFLEKINNTVS